MKRITILIGGQGHGLQIKPMQSDLAEIKKYGLVYRKRVCKHSDREGKELVEFELYAWEAVPDDILVQLAGAAIRRGFVSEH